MTDKYHALKATDFSDAIDDTETAEIYIGGYCLIRELASGPSCRTFLAETVSLTSSERVVIKWFYTIHLTNQQAKQDFLREVGKFKRLHHSAILPILSAGIYTDTPYLVMPFMESGSLFERLQQPSGCTWARQHAIPIITQLGQALTYAHEHGILHGNLKTHNILLTARDEIRLADFTFLSLASSISPPVSQTGDISDEAKQEDYERDSQKEGAHLAGAHTDQHALGCIAYELLTGHTPIPVPPVDMSVSRGEVPITPRQFNAEIAPHTEEAVLKALAPEPAERHQDITSFLRALEAPTMLLPVATEPESTPTSAPYSELDRLPTMPVAVPPPANYPLLPTPQQSTALIVSSMPTAVQPIAGHYAPSAPYTRQKQNHSLLRQGWSLFVLAGILCLIIFCLIGTHILTRFPSQQPQEVRVTSLLTPDTQAATRVQTTRERQTPAITPTAPTIAPKPTITQQAHVPVQRKPSPLPTPTPTKAAKTPSPSPSETLFLSVAPTRLSPRACSHSSDYYTCTVTLSSNADSLQDQSWSASADENLHASITPDEGSLSPGDQTQITLFISDDCPQSGSITFYGSESETQIAVLWQC